MPVKSAVRLGSGLFSDFRVGSFFCRAGKNLPTKLHEAFAVLNFLLIFAPR